MQLKKMLLITVAVGVVAFVCGSVARAALINGDFSSGLNGWESGGSVTLPKGEAILSDTVYWSYLYQGVELEKGLYTIEFDFYATGISDDIPTEPFAFPDSFFTTIYFTNTFSQFNLNVATSYSDDNAMFDYDNLGIYNNNGVVSSSIISDWTHFSMTFNNKYSYVIPTFELLNINSMANDSQVLIDNVSINPVPEPATFILFATGLAGLVGVTRKKLKKPVENNYF